MTDTIEVIKAAQQSDEPNLWIEWSGGNCPVPSETIVQIRMRDGQETPAKWFTPAKEWGWMRGDREYDGDIIAYRVVRP